MRFKRRNTEFGNREALSAGQFGAARFVKQRITQIDGPLICLCPLAILTQGLLPIAVLFRRQEMAILLRDDSAGPGKRIDQIGTDVASAEDRSELIRELLPKGLCYFGRHNWCQHAGKGRTLDELWSWPP